MSLAPLQTICSIYSLHTARFGGAKRRYKSHLSAIYSAPLRLTFSAASNAVFWPTLVTSRPHLHTFPPFICRLLRAEAGERKQFNTGSTFVTIEKYSSRIFKNVFYEMAMSRLYSVKNTNFGIRIGRQKIIF